MVRSILFGWLIAVASVVAAAPCKLDEQPPSDETKSSRLYAEVVSTALEDLERAFTILAIIAGGAWVYFNFLRGRTYQPRLELSVSGSIAERDGLTYIVATIVLKNVGLSRVELKREGTACTVKRATKQVGMGEFSVVKDWADVGISRIFENHRWIEPGETVLDHCVAAIPKTDTGVCRFEARVVGKKNNEWNASSVVMRDAQDWADAN